MKKNMVVISIVAVLSVSHVVGMNKRGSENQATVNADLNKNIDRLAQGMQMAVNLLQAKKDAQSGLKKIQAPTFNMKKLANKVATAQAQNKGARVPAKGAFTQTKKTDEVKSNFFSKLYQYGKKSVTNMSTMISKNKKSIALGVVLCSAAALAAYTYYDFLYYRSLGSNCIPVGNNLKVAYDLFVNGDHSNIMCSH